MAYGASRANPNATVNWSQFEPLVGIPAVDPRDVTPYAEHWMASVERQFGAATLATVSYVGASSHHLLVLEEANPANPALCLSLGSALCGPFNEQAARTQFGPAFGSVELQRTIANASYNALEATLNHRSHGLDLLASYTCSKSIDQSAGLPEPVNPVNPSLSRGLSSFDLRHNLVASFHYRFARARSPRAGSMHWPPAGRVAGIARFTSGLPVTLLNNNDTSLLGTIPNGINNNGVDTPDWSGKSLSLHTNPRGGAPVFDASQFTLPALGTMGNARRRFFSGPGMENLDATLSRRLPASKDDRALEFRAEAFNLAQPRPVLRRRRGRGQHLQRQLRPGRQRHAAAPDAAGAALPVLTGSFRISPSNPCSLLLRINEVVGDGEQGQFEARGDAGLVEDVRQVALDGLFAEAELLGDVAVAAALDDAAHDFKFARGEAVGLALRARRPAASGRGGRRPG